MSRNLFLVDAFAASPFKGNAAGVVLLDDEAPERWMQSVANEMNQAETAFIVPSGQEAKLRWFTPTTEVDLCGHATLAAAHVLFSASIWTASAGVFHTKSGPLTVTRRAQGRYSMDFPREMGAEHQDASEFRERIVRILGKEPIWFGRNRMDWLAQTDEETVRKLQPDMTEISKLGMRGLIVTAMDQRGQDYDFVSRFFAPQSGVPEDSVTGSAHCFLGPFWAERWAKTKLIGFQCSPRSGFVEVECVGDRCYLTGDAVTVMQGNLLA